MNVRLEELVQEARGVVITLTMARTIAQLYDLSEAIADLRHAHRRMSELSEALEALLLKLEAR